MTIKEETLRMLAGAGGESVSGAAIASALGVTRSAVWKAIGELRGDGYEIDAVTKRGYRLRHAGEVLDKKKVEQFLRQARPGCSLHFFELLDSTNAKAKELAIRGAPDQTVVIALRQSAGRGRMGRTFYSPGGTGIYLTVILRRRFPLEDSLLITCAAAVAAARAIEKQTGERLSIKWVNDLFRGEKKIGGILTEASFDLESGRADYVIVGVGINCSEPEGGFPAALAEVAGAVGEKGKLDKSLLAADLVLSILAMAEKLDERTFLTDYRERSNLLGRRVRALCGKDSWEGKAVSIDDDCHLHLELESGEELVLRSGEASVRW